MCQNSAPTNCNNADKGDSGGLAQQGTYSKLRLFSWLSQVLESSDKTGQKYHPDEQSDKQVHRVQLRLNLQVGKDLSIQSNHQESQTRTDQMITVVPQGPAGGLLGLSERLNDYSAPAIFVFTNCSYSTAAVQAERNSLPTQRV